MHLVLCLYTSLTLCNLETLPTFQLFESTNILPNSGTVKTRSQHNAIAIEPRLRVIFSIVFAIVRCSVMQHRVEPFQSEQCNCLRWHAVEGCALLISFEIIYASCTLLIPLYGVQRTSGESRRWSFSENGRLLSNMGHVGIIGQSNVAFLPWKGVFVMLIVDSAKWLC